MSDLLPRDVLIDILIRLPIKTLVRFTCVCKSWYSLLTNPSFITTHLNRPSLEKYNNNNNNVGDLLLLRTYSKDRSEEHYSVHCDNESFDELLKLEFPFKTIGDHYFWIIGSCNGLICFTDDLSSCTHTTILWNPSIRKSLTLPRPRVTFESHGPHVHVFGFGFDSLTNDYKVVRIVYLECAEIPAEVDVFTVNTGAWRNISHLGLSCHINERGRRATLNGAAHWVAIDRTNGFHHLIVSFSMSDEVFREIKPPDIIDSFDVVNFHESLALFETKSYSNSSNYCIWVMKEYGVAESWTKQIVIDLHGCDLKWFVGFRKNGEVLLASRRGYLENYDPKEKQLKDLRNYNHAYPFFVPSFYVAAYMECLVLLGVKSFEGSPDLHEEGSGPKKIKKGKEEREEQEIKSKKEGNAESG